MNAEFDSLKRPRAKEDEGESDSPPGTEGTYVRGPLATQTPKPKPDPNKRSSSSGY